MVTKVLAGRYEVRTLIGRGGMAEVHLGYDTRLSRMVAIKMLRLDLARDSIFQARFRREAQSAASLNHPNIVAVYDTGEERILAADGAQVDVPFIIMEYVEGHTVRELLSDGAPVPIDEAVEIMGGVLSALQYSHSQGLVHRDIKPGNVMLTNSGKVKVMDFGIARALEDSAATMTQTDAVVGTAQYLSPEQARGDQVDARSDLYSAGCLLFELLTGMPPFRGDTAVAVAYQHVSELPPTPSAITSDVPEAIDRVVLKSLAKHREDRYADANQMLADLRAAVSGGAVGAPAVHSWDAPTAPTQQMRPLPMATYAAPTDTLAQTRLLQQQREEQRQAKKRRSITGWVLFFIGLVLLVGGVIYALSLNSDDTANQTVVPSDIIGKDPAQVRSVLTEAGLEMIIGPEVASDTVPKGMVADSDPKPGTSVDRNSKVMVNLSSGKAEVSVPDLSNMSQEQARSELQKLNLRVGTVTTTDSPRVPKDKIVETKPKAGEKVQADTLIDLVVSNGKVTIPEDLIGKTEAEVVAALNALNISTNTIKVQTNDRDPGTVVHIEPKGTVDQGASVTVQVAEPLIEDPLPPQPTATRQPPAGNQGNNGNNQQPPAGGNQGGAGTGNAG